MKRFFAVFTALTLTAACMAGCAGSASSQASSLPQSSSFQPENQDLSLSDNPLNQDDIGSTELLVVSFGTSYNTSRIKTIGAIEKAMENAFSEASVRRAFTSETIINRLAERDQIEIDNIEKALDRAVNNQVKKLVVQPTHLMAGLEYEELLDTLARYADSFEELAVGTPLLTDEQDFSTLAQALYNSTAVYHDPNTAICFMGHGTEAESNQVYTQLQQQFIELGYDNCYVGTVEADPCFEDVLACIQKSPAYNHIVLQPLMVVAGDHATNDMAGDDPDSWKSQFEAAGYQVECVMVGLGELKEVQQMYVAHAQTAFSQLT